MSAHTTGPLHVFDVYHDTEIRDQADQVVACIHSGSPQSLANARRLAACWNACDGVTTKALEELGPIARAIADPAQTRIFELEAQRDELLTALKSYLRAPSVGSNGPGSATIVVQEFNVRAAKAVVDRLTKTPPTAGTPGQ